MGHNYPGEICPGNICPFFHQRFVIPMIILFNHIFRDSSFRGDSLFRSHKFPQSLSHVFTKNLVSPQPFLNNFLTLSWHILDNSSNLLPSLILPSHMLHTFTTISQHFFDNPMTFAQPFHNNSSTLPWYFLNISSTLPQCFINHHHPSTPQGILPQLVGTCMVMWTIPIFENYLKLTDWLLDWLTGWLTDWLTD